MAPLRDCHEFEDKVYKDSIFRARVQQLGLTLKVNDYVAFIVLILLLMIAIPIIFFTIEEKMIYLENSARRSVAYEIFALMGKIFLVILIISVMAGLFTPKLGPNGVLKICKLIVIAVRITCPLGIALIALIALNIINLTEMIKATLLMEGLTLLLLFWILGELYYDYIIPYRYSLCAMYGKYLYGFRKAGNGTPFEPIYEIGAWRIEFSSGGLLINGKDSGLREVLWATLCPVETHSRSLSKSLYIAVVINNLGCVMMTYEKVPVGFVPLCGPIGWDRKSLTISIGNKLFKFTRALR